MEKIDVIDYLISHPDFFTDNQDLLHSFQNFEQTKIHGSNVLSLSSRQIPQLQQKVRALEGQINEFVNTGERNQKIWESILNFTLNLLRIDKKSTDFGQISSLLCEHFNLDKCKIFTVPRDTKKNSAEENIFANFISSMSKPECFPEPPIELKHLTSSWLLNSSAYVPISTLELIGVLIFSSSDPLKFEPDMDVQFLKRIGELISTTVENNS
jgi:uncharacterized protein YigA (DUF484 family)